MMGTFTLYALFISLLRFAVPAVILYFLIKLAIKNAIKELKDEGML